METTSFPNSRTQQQVSSEVSKEEEKDRHVQRTMNRLEDENKTVNRASNTSSSSSSSKRKSNQSGLDTASTPSSMSVWAKLQSLKSSSTDPTYIPSSSPPDSGRTSIRDYAANEPRPISMTIAKEIAAMIPEIDTVSLTSGGWIAHPGLSMNKSRRLNNMRQSQSTSSTLLSSNETVDDTETLLLQLLVSQAMIDAQDFEVLNMEEVEEVKNLHQQLQLRVKSQGSRLALETKIREAARNLARLHANNRELSRQANDQLQQSNRKVDQVATELWKLTQRAAEVQRRLLQHTAGTLARGVKMLEQQLDILRAQVDQKAMARADAQLVERLNAATQELRQEADAQRRIAEARQREIVALRGELEATSVKLQTLSMVSQAGDEAARNAESRLAAIEEELAETRERLQQVEAELEEARVQLERQESPSDLRAAVQASLRDAMLSKEKSRAEADAERRRRKEVEERLETVQRELEEAREALAAQAGASEANLAEALKERDRLVANLQRQIKEATEDIDQLSQASRETDAALRELFSMIPEHTTSHTSELSGGMGSKAPLSRAATPGRYTFDGLVIRVQGMLSEHQRLIDRVLELQSRVESLHMRADAALLEKAEAETRANDMAERLAVIEAQLKEVHARVDEAEMRAEEAETRAEEAEARMREAVRRAEEAEERAEAAEHDIRRMSLNIVSPHEAYDDMSERSAQQIKELRNELELAREREASVRVTLTRVKRELELAQKRAEAAEEAQRRQEASNDAEAIEAKIEERMKGLRASLQEASAAERAESERRLNEANAKIVKLERSVAELQRKLNDAQETINRLQTQLKEANDENAEVKEQLDNALAKVLILETEADRPGSNHAAATALVGYYDMDAEHKDDKLLNLRQHCVQIQERLLNLAKQYPVPPKHQVNVDQMYSMLSGLSQELTNVRVAMADALKGVKITSNDPYTSPPMHRRTLSRSSTSTQDPQTELELAYREIERLQRQVAEWNDERLMLQMNLDAYRARIEDLERA
jgi:chromosome segregation ATPase